MTKMRSQLEQARTDLARATACAAATLECSTDGVVITDADGRITGFNGKFAEMWRLSRDLLESGKRDEIITKLGNQLARPDSFLASWRQIEREGGPETFDTIDFPDGRVFERVTQAQIVNGEEVGRVWSFRDVTQRSHADRERQHQAELFRVTVGTIADGVVTVDESGKVTSLNPAAEMLSGWKSADALGQPITEVLKTLHERTGKPTANPVAIALSKGVVVEFSNHTLLQRRDGTKIPIEDSAAPIRGAEGGILGAVLVFRDVSDRRNRENALAASEQRFRLIGEVVPQLLWTATPDGKREYLNERWESFLGKPNDSWDWADVVHPEDHDRTMEAWHSAVKSGGPFETEFRLRRADGEYRWFISRGLPLKDNTGAIARWYGACTDIHQQKLTAEALRDEYLITEQLHDVATSLATELDIAKVAQIITDAATRITRAQLGVFYYCVAVQEGAQQMLHAVSGVDQEAFEPFENASPMSLFGREFRGALRAEDARHDARFGKGERTRPLPTGRLPVASYLAVPVTARNGEIIGGLFFGHTQPGVFTERDEKMALGIAAQAAAAMDTARLYDAAQQARSAAEHASQAKDLFLAALSHELRTPLTPALAVLSDLRDDASVSADLRSQLHMIERNIELEARLIEDLLDLTRITRGKLDLHLQPIDLVQMVELAVDSCTADIETKRIEIRRELIEPPRALVADMRRVTQVLWNLLKNAIKFTPKSGSITLRSAPDPQNPAWWIVEVEDTGMGIERENLRRIFEPFEQGARMIAQRFGGLGLGLAISRAIAESHGGMLTAASAGLNQGSTFTLRLPLTMAGASRPKQVAPEEPAVPAPPAPKPAPRRLRILLVEDHPDTAAVLQKLLTRMGHHVASAARVAEAKTVAARMIDHGGIDIVISDLGLPDGSGLDLMRNLASAYHVRGIALSGFGMESDVDQSKAAGFSRHLIKPLDVTEVSGAIAEVLAEK